MNLFKLLLVLSLCISCGQDKRDPTLGIVPFNSEVRSYNQFNIILPNYYSNEEKDLLIGAMKTHITTFEANELITSLPATIGVINTHMTFKGEDVVGLNYRYKIICFHGDRFNVYALYHELCHLNFAPDDFYHLNLNWPKWESRRKTVSDCIYNSRPGVGN